MKRKYLTSPGDTVGEEALCEGSSPDSHVLWLGGRKQECVPVIWSQPQEERSDFILRETVFRVFALAMKGIQESNNLEYMSALKILNMFPDVSSGVLRQF